MAKYDLLPMIEDYNLANQELIAKKTASHMNQFATLLSKVAEVPSEGRVAIASRSKLIRKRKKELGITVEMENVIREEFICSLLGSIANKTNEQNRLNATMKLEFDSMTPTFKKIVECLRMTKSPILQKDLAKKLSMSSCNITKQMNKNKSFHFVKQFRMSNNIVYYSLYDDAKHYLKNNKSSSTSSLRCNDVPYENRLCGGRPKKKNDILELKLGGEN